MFKFLSRGSRSANLVCSNRESLSESSLELAKAEGENADEPAGTILCTTYFDIELFPPDAPEVPAEDVPIANPDTEPTLLPYATTSSNLSRRRCG